MRQALAFFVYASVLGFAVSADAAPTCSYPYEFPVDFMVCSDAQLAELDREVDALYGQASSLASAHHLPDSHALRRTMENKCNLPLLIAVPQALRARPCIIAEYVTEIKSLAALSRPNTDRLHSRPVELNSANAYFTILSYHNTFGEAQGDFTRLKEEFPFEEFALYPPGNGINQWAIVFSSYIDEQQAARSRDLAIALEISPDPRVFRLPNPLSHAPAWLATTPSEPPAAAVSADTAANSDDLNVRLAIWRRDALLCTMQRTIWQKSMPAVADLFPTKEDPDQRTQNPEPCNDGDMTLFNGMLCAAGEAHGCSAVRNSEGSTHQWWRSPALRARGHDDANEPNLNSDQVLGLLLYVLQENKRDDFRDWLEWIQSNGTPPKFCSINTDKCWFRPMDCPLIAVNSKSKTPH